MTLMGTSTRTPAVTAASMTGPAEMQRWLDTHQHLAGSDAYERVAARLLAILAAPRRCAIVNGAVR